MANRGWRLEDDLKAFRDGTIADWTSLGAAALNPEWAAGRYAVVRLRLSALTLDKATGAVVATGEEWTSHATPVGQETRTVMRAVESGTVSFIGGEAGRGQAAITSSGAGAASSFATAFWNVSTSGRWGYSSSITRIPVPETRIVWRKEFERTGMIATVVIPKFDPDLPAEHWLYVLGVVRDFANSKQVEQKNIPVIEVVGLWKASEGPTGREREAAPAH